MCDWWRRSSGRFCGHLEDEVAESGLFEPKVVYGYFPAQADGNDVVVYDAERAAELARPDSRWRLSPHVNFVRFTFPRQREGRRLCISDFFAPKASGKMDVIGLSLVTIGSKASVETQRLFEGGEYTKYLYLHGLSVETAEALAELHHKKMREELGIAGEDASEIRDLFHQKYRGSRYSFGYPACPNLEDQTKLFALLKPEENVGVRLTSGFLLEPGAEHVGDCGAPSRGEVLRGVENLQPQRTQGTQRKFLATDFHGSARTRLESNQSADWTPPVRPLLFRFVRTRLAGAASNFWAGRWCSRRRGQRS